ncbi:MAG: hypothetical protein HYS32_00120 [Candidatus Woesearchaeota archaeon]|nr:MAG: hypothetical protein HYS32_00120 [Candidatus Woesearchaeota archaeon]
MKVTKETDFPLLSRKEVLVEIGYQGKPTPKEEEIKKQLAEALKEKEELIKIKKIAQLYGEHKARVFAYIYKTAEAFKRFEHPNKKKKVKKVESGKEKGKEQKAK